MTIQLIPYGMEHESALIQQLNQKEISQELAYPYPFHESDAKNTLQKLQTSNGGSRLFAISNGDSQVGFIGFNVSKQKHLAQTFYWISKPYWRRGYASAALQQLKHIVHDEYGLIRLQALVSPDNKASQVLLEKSGFVSESLLRRFFFNSQRKESQNVIMYAHIRED